MRDFLICLLFCACLTASVRAQNTDTYDYAKNQLLSYKARKNGNVEVLTTGYGQPVEYHQTTTTLNQNIFENQYFFDAISHFSRERVAERGTHPKGIGAFGYFEVTNDVTKYTRAKFLEKIGKKTEVALRFSQSFRDKGDADTIRGGIGFAAKFYTEEGNMDLTCFNTPTFAIADPINGPSFIHAQKKNPVTNMNDVNIIWDYFTKLPEQLNAVIFTFADRGMPKSFRYIDAYPVHTYEVENANGDLHYIRFIFLTNQGHDFLLNNESAALRVSDPDYFTRDLYNAIARGDYPTWTLVMQVMTYEETQAAPFDVFSVNKYWPEDLYPHIEIGKLVVNRNPTNWFHEVEQASYQPGHLVPGINGGVDNTFQFRSFMYRDQQLNRIGPNFLEIPVNRAKGQVNTYIRGGYSEAVNPGDGPNYYPNSFNGPKPYVFANYNNKTLIGKQIAKERKDNDILGLSTRFYLMRPADERLRMASTFSASIGVLTAPGLQEKSLVMIGGIHPELESNVRAILNGTFTV